MKLSVITSVLLLCLSGFWVADAASGKEIPIKFKGQKIGSVFTEKIKINEETEDADRMVFTTPIEFDSITQAIDNYFRERGDLIKGCSKRLYWVGSTGIRESGIILKLSSRVRYEQWTCAKILGKRLKTRLFRATKSVHWDLYFDKANSKIVALLTNIKNFPNALEKPFGLKFKKEIDIPIPKQCGKCPCKSAMDPQIESVAFKHSDGKVILEMNVSIRNNLAIAVKCFIK